MKRGSTVFLQVVIVLLGIGTFGLMLWEPHLEGRNVNATLFQIYFNDPFLAYVYVASIAFFVALYQAFKLLGDIGRNNVFTTHSIQALKTIKYCALALIAFIIGAEAYLILVQRKIEEDIAGGIAMGLFMIVISSAVAVTVAVLEKKLTHKIS